MIWLPEKILDTLKYLSLYKCSSRMSNDLELTALEIHQCGKDDWDETAVRQVFMFYEFLTADI